MGVWIRLPLPRDHKQSALLVTPVNGPVNFLQVNRMPKEKKVTLMQVCREDYTAKSANRDSEKADPGNSVDKYLNKGSQMRTVGRLRQ